MRAEASACTVGPGLQAPNASARFAV